MLSLKSDNITEAATQNEVKHIRGILGADIIEYIDTTKTKCQKPQLCWLLHLCAVFPVRFSSGWTQGR